MASSTSSKGSEFYLSPGAATAERSALEERLVRATRAATKTFDQRVRAAARDGRLTPPLAAREWQAAVERVTRQVPQRYRATVAEALTNSGVPDATYEALTEVLADSRRQSWSASRTDRELREATPTDAWAVTSARTAATQWTSEAARAAMEADPDVVSKRWIAHHDGKTRPSHLAADGQTVPLAQSFKVGGEMLRYPGDPRGTPTEVANCRCVISAVRRNR